MLVRAEEGTCVVFRGGDGERGSALDLRIDDGGGCGREGDGDGDDGGEGDNDDNDDSDDNDDIDEGGDGALV